MIFPSKAPSNLVECRAIHILYLAERMRDEEKEQFCALAYRDSFDPDEAARAFINIPGVKFCLVDAEGFALAAGGFEQIAPAVWQSWMLGSYEGWEHWRDLTKATRWLMGQLFNSGARRLQTSCLASRQKASEWFTRSLGMTHEGTRRDFGYGGQDVLDFALIRGQENG